MLSDSTTGTPFTAVVRTNAVEVVQAQIADHLASGAVRIGDRLPPEISLATMFGVSRTVIREALGALKGLGLVATRNGRGTFVMALTPQGAPLVLHGGYSTDDLHEVRHHLEPPGTALAARRRTDADVICLRANVEAQRSCGDIQAWAGLDADFHVLVADSTHNSIHSRVIASMRELHEEQSAKVLTISGRTDRSLREHEGILAAIEAGDEPAARAAMEQHLKRVRILSHELNVPTPRSGTSTTEWEVLRARA